MLVQGRASPGPLRRGCSSQTFCAKMSQILASNLFLPWIVLSGFGVTSVRTPRNGSHRATMLLPQTLSRPGDPGRTRRGAASRPVAASGSAAGAPRAARAPRGSPRRGGRRVGPGLRFPRGLPAPGTAPTCRREATWGRAGGGRGGDLEPDLFAGHCHPRVTRAAANRWLVGNDCSVAQ